MKEGVIFFKIKLLTAMLLSVFGLLEVHALSIIAPSTSSGDFAGLPIFCHQQRLSFSADTDNISQAEYQWTLFRTEQDDSSSVRSTHFHNFDIYTKHTGYYTVRLDQFSGATITASTEFSFFVPPSADFGVFYEQLPRAVCLGEEISVSGDVQFNEWNNVNTLGAPVYIPEVGGGLKSELYNKTYSPSQSIQSPEDIEHIEIHIEHSYLEDLTISIECPSGQDVTLHTGGNYAILGQPIKGDNNSPDRGNTHVYQWKSMNTDYGKMSAECTRHRTSYKDKNGVDHTDVLALPAGSYLPESSFKQLVGCPINGKWKLKIHDKTANDNGFVDEWDIMFTPKIEETKLPIYSPRQVETVHIESEFDFVRPEDKLTIFKATQTGEHLTQLSIRNEHGCLSQAQLETDVEELPEVEFDTDSICLNETFSPDNLNQQEGVVYEWNFDGFEEQWAEGFEPQHRFEYPGVYYPILKAESALGCKNERQSETPILVRPLPEATMDITPDRPDIIQNNEIELSAFSYEEVEYEWVFDNNTVFTGDYVTVEVPRAGRIPLELRLSSEFCSDTLRSEVYVFDETKPYSASAFIPDGDGINRYFTPVSSSPNCGDLELQIFNRSGGLVFSTKGLCSSPDGWDGTTSDGSPAPTGSYIWLLKQPSPVSDTGYRLIDGHVTLIR